MKGAMFERAWAQINLDCLTANLKKVVALVKPGTKIMAVIKADAYGHGDIRAAKRFLNHGANWLAVDNIAEALRIRNSGILAPILIFGPTPVSMAKDLFQHDISQSVHSWQYAQELSQAAKSRGCRVKCHTKIETGMNRLGFVVDSGLDELLKVYALPGLEPEGIFTHFSSADQTGPEAVVYTKQQFEKFVFVCKQLVALGVAIGMRHCCNSAATVLFPHMHLDMVRPGMVLYGLPGRSFAKLGSWLPAMTLKSRITSVKLVPAGQCVGYGRSYTTNKETLLGVVSIGYADGVRRGLSNNMNVLVRGKLTPILGNICMDQMMVDLSGVPGASVGDEVVVFGDHEGCNVNIIASKLGTIHYEIVCGVGSSVPRLFI